MAVVIPAAAAIATVRNAEYALDCTNGATDTGTDDAPDSAAHGTGNAVTFMGAFLGAAHDALGMTGLRQRQQREQDGGGCKQQADGQVRRR